MIEFDAKKIATITKGKFIDIKNILSKKITINNISIDSRQIRDNSLFVAIFGDKTDGHLYIQEAFKYGATLALVTNKNIYNNKDNVLFPRILVKNIDIAILKIASFMIYKFKQNRTLLKVVGITGSSGKTTTKDILYEIFKKKYNTIASKKSFNNNLGVALTIFTADFSTQLIIIEIGATHLGDILKITKYIKLDIAVITCIGNAHIGTFGSKNNILKAKFEILQYLKKNTFAIINIHDLINPFILQNIKTNLFGFFTEGMKNLKNKRFYFLNFKKIIWATNIYINKNGYSEFKLSFLNFSNFSYKNIDIKSKLIGLHQINNMLAAATTAYILNIPLSNIKYSLNTFNMKNKWRMEKIVLNNNIIIINDAYNANPESMTAALYSLKSLQYRTKENHCCIYNKVKKQNIKYTTWAILGGMLDLGKYSDIAHKKIGRLVLRLDFNYLLVVGKEAYLIYKEAIKKNIINSLYITNIIYVKNIDTALNVLKIKLKKRSLLLIKSSNKIGLGNLSKKIALIFSEKKNINQSFKSET